MTQICGLNGAGNDFKHQIIISFLIHSFMSKFKFKTYKNHYAIPELTLNPKSPRIPDLTIYKKNKSKYSPIIFFEICNDGELNNDIEKLQNLMNDFPTVKECFVINKEDDSVHRIFRKKDLTPSTAKRSKVCKTFKLDLSKIIQKLP